MALSELEALLSQKRIDPNEVVTRKFFAKRLGGPVEISFRRLSYRVYKSVKQLAIVRTKRSENFDLDKYRVNIILSCLTNPDFSKKEFLDSFGAFDGEDGVKKIFLPGEIASLGEMILDESGFIEEPFRDELPEDEGTSEGEE